MAQVSFKRGTQEELEQESLQDGLLSFTTDDGRIHLDYRDDTGKLVRKTFYSGKLTIGNHVYDGTQNVKVEVYGGDIQNK